LLIIFVFDPLAIVLIIATNQSFNNLKPKLNIYGEPKPTPITQEYQSDPAIEQEKQRIKEEIANIQNNNKGSSSSRSIAINTLNNRLSSLNDDNTKTY
jgi:hypothetical protein